MGEKREEGDGVHDRRETGEWRGKGGGKGAEGKVMVGEAIPKSTGPPADATVQAVTRGFVVSDNSTRFGI